MKKWLLIPIVLCVFLVIFVVLSPKDKTITPSTQIFTTPTPYPTLALAQALKPPAIMTSAPSLPVDVSTITFPIPQNINLYQVTSRSIPTEIINAFLSTFALTSQTTNPGVISWLSEDQTQQLVVTDSGYLTYTNSYLPPKGILQKIRSVDEAVSYAKSLATKLQMQPTDFMQSQTYLAKSDGSHMSATSDFTTATVVGIEFKRILSGLPVYAQGANSDSMVIWVNKYGIAEKITFQYAFINGYEKVTSPTLSAIKTRLTQGEGKIVSSGEDTPQITSITAQSATIGYLDDRQTSLIQPIIVVEGVGKTITGSTIPVSVYLPMFIK